MLCNVSFLFVEYHNLHANMSAYGFPSNRSKDPHMTFYSELGARVRALMDRPGCRLGIHWRTPKTQSTRNLEVGCQTCLGRLRI